MGLATVSSVAIPPSSPAIIRPGRLRFSLGGNAKLPYYVAAFSLPSGHTCPGACDCLAKRDMETGRLIESPGTKFRCFSASSEVAFPTIWRARSHNLSVLKACASTLEMARELQRSLPKGYPVIRIHVGGDFFNQRYFDAWLVVARFNPQVIFYAYTKSLRFWVRRLNGIPKNFVLTASRGGKMDSLIDTHQLREARVVYHPDEAKALGMEIDHDDSMAMKAGPSFALLVHGVQKPGSAASIAMKKMRNENIEYGYKRNGNSNRPTNQPLNRSG